VRTSATCRPFVSTWKTSVPLPLQVSRRSRLHLNCILHFAGGEFRMRALQKSSTPRKNELASQVKKGRLPVGAGCDPTSHNVHARRAGHFGLVGCAGGSPRSRRHIVAPAARATARTGSSDGSPHSEFPPPRHSAFYFCSAASNFPFCSVLPTYQEAGPSPSLS